MTKKLEISLVIPASAEFVGVARLAISGVASRMNFSIDEIEDIKISISEACTTVIQHAYGENVDPQKHVIDIKVFIVGSELEIVVKDFGHGFDVSIVGTREQKKKSEERMGLGLGLTFIKSLMDYSDFQSKQGEGTVIQMKKQPANIELVNADA